MTDFDVLRILAVFFTGASLSLATTLIQSITKNDLSSPSTLGIDGISVFVILIGYFVQMVIGGASLVIVAWVLMGIFLFVFSLFSRRLNLSSSQYLILGGLCINLFVGAVFSLVQFFVLSSSFEFPTSIWFGNFKQVLNYDLAIVASIFIAAYILSIKNIKNLLKLTFGQSFCREHNLAVSPLNSMVLLVSLALTFSTTAHFGVFSFIGLVFVHLCRMIFPKRGLGFEIKTMPVIAGLLLVVLDILCYELPVNGVEIPVGLICSLVGSLSLLLITLRVIQQKSKLHL